MILGFSHAAIVVPDVDKAREFYEKMFGFRYFCKEGWENSTTVDNIVGIEGSASRGYMLAGHNCYLELFEFSRPAPSAPSPASLGPHEPGIRHLCFYVDNCRTEYKRLLMLGGNVLGEPTKNRSGVYIVYCRDPFGNIIELAEPPTPEEDLRNLPGIDSLGSYTG